MDQGGDATPSSMRLPKPDAKRMCSRYVSPTEAVGGVANRDGPDRDCVAAHFAAISATVVSSIRLEKPHSLSYQLETLTSRPDTLVSVASNVDDAGSWLKSIETSGPVL